MVAGTPYLLIRVSYQGLVDRLCGMSVKGASSNHLVFRSIMDKMYWYPPPLLELVKGPMMSSEPPAQKAEASGAGEP